MPKMSGSLQKKLLLLLSGGVALALTSNPKYSFRIIRGISREWRRINQQSLYRAIRSLYKSKLVDARELSDGCTQLTLNEEGRKRVLCFNLDEMKLSAKGTWDQLWRMVIFDIPEVRKKEREAMRHHLKRLGFHHLQKSVFIFPYDCKNEIDFLIEFHNLRKYVRYIVAIELDNDLHLRDIFQNLIKR